MGVPTKLRDEVAAIYKEKIAEKNDFITEHAASFLRRFFLDSTTITVALSVDQIHDVVINYFVDIQRFKERRDMEGEQISAGKIAAFTAKWLVKFKPFLVILDTNVAGTEASIFIARHVNEIFAVTHAERILGKDFPRKLFLELVLDFRQKKFSETQLYMVLEQHIGYYAIN
jgi:hypothetical protein